MSSTTNNDSLPDNHSNVYFLVPLTAVVVLGLLAFWIQRRRTLRKSGRRPNIYAIDATGRRILERDLENAWVRGATRRSTIPAAGGQGAAPYSGPPRQGHTYHTNNINNNGGGTTAAAAAGTTGRRTRPSNRWAWIQHARLPEEGLNELGEAPPPYDRRRKHAQGKDDVVVEMQTPRSVHEDARCAGPSTDGGSREEPQPPPPAAGPDGEAPAYEEAPGRSRRSPGAADGEVASAMLPPPGYEAAGGDAETIARPSPAYVAVAASRRSL